MTGPTDKQLLAFERDHPRHTSRKEEQLRRELSITPARYYQLLGRLIWTEEALQIDPMLTNRLRRMSQNRILANARRLT